MPVRLCARVAQTTRAALEGARDECTVLQVIKLGGVEAVVLTT